MQRKIVMEGIVSEVTLSNVGQLEELDYTIEDLNEAADIESFMLELDAYASSGELNSLTDVESYRIMNSEDIEYCAQNDEGREVEITLDSFKLSNETLEPIKELLKNARSGDIIYLRKDQGKGSFEISLEVEESSEMSIGYFDCSESLDGYDLLRESYYEVVCDTILPETISSGENKGVVENFLFEPQLIYGELYRVVTNESGEKSLDRVALPGYYFQEDSRRVEE